MDNHEYHYASLSEVESLSDSDWLDIASSRASEDNDSLAAFEDSDRDDFDGRPASRHSFASYSSSRDEPVEAWEGLIDDVSDLETPMPLPAQVGLTSPLPAEDRPASPPAEDESEDERVKAALDQSMMSTLSSSRSNSLANSVQTSMVSSTRALRLSFPDPTTSSPESLAGSFDKLTRSDIRMHEPSADDALPQAAHAADPGASPTPEVAAGTSADDDALEHTIVSSRAKPDMVIVLYGSSLSSKQWLVSILLRKWALNNGLLDVCGEEEDSRVVSYVFKPKESFNGKIASRRVSVIDNMRLDESPVPVDFNCPSLALVFLPTLSNVYMHEHNLYIPILTSSSDPVHSLLSSIDPALEAERQWEEMGIPANQLTSLSQASSPIVDEEVLARATPAQVQRVFKTLSPALSTKKPVAQVSAYAISIMAVLSIVLGYVVHGSMSSEASAVLIHPVTQTKAVSSQIITTANVHVNNSSPTQVVDMSTPCSALTHSGFKDFALALFNPTPLAAVTTTQTNAPSQPIASSSSHSGPSSVAGVAPSECGCGCGLLTWPGKTDVMVRQTPASSAISTYGTAPKSVALLSTPQQQHHHHHHQSHSHHSVKGKEKATGTVDSEDTSLYGMSTRIVTSLSSSLSSYISLSLVSNLCLNLDTALETVLGRPLDRGNDMQELLDALDRLLRAISLQTALIWKQSRSTLDVLRDELKERNEHAKERARQMRKVGMKWVGAVGEHIKVRAEAARVNARAMRERVQRQMEERADREKSEGWGVRAEGAVETQNQDKDQEEFDAVCENTDKDVKKGRGKGKARRAAKKEQAKTEKETKKGREDLGGFSRRMRRRFARHERRMPRYMRKALKAAQAERAVEREALLHEHQLA